MAISDKHQYQLLFKPAHNSAEDKINMLTGLLAGQCKPFEKIDYLSDRADIYCNEHKWTNALKDIAEIEVLTDGRLNHVLRAIKTKATVQLDLEKIRQVIGSAIASGLDQKKQFDALMDHLSEQAVAHLFEDTHKKQQHSKKFKYCS